VPTDFSDCSEQAWALAQRLAGAIGSELILVHVLVEAPLYSEGPFTIERTRYVFGRARTWAGESLEKWAAGAKDKGLKVRTALRSGAAYREIVGLAADEGADLVIIGSHGRGGVSRALLGSVADRVIRLTRCPVLTVRGGE